METSETTKEIIFIINQFNNYEVVDYDNNYVVLRKNGFGAVEAHVIRGSFGSYDYKFIVEKFGERNRIFSGKTAIQRIKKYLK